MKIPPFALVSREIRRMREFLGLSQEQLAEKVGKNRATIIRLEKDALGSSSYRLVEETLAKLEEELHKRKDDPDKRENIQAERIMSKPVVCVESTDSVKKALVKMKGAFSQLPVVKDGKVVGTFYEEQINELMLQLGEKKRVLETRIDRIMKEKEAMPQVSKTTPLEIVEAFLKRAKAVLVVEKDRPIGIITGFDLLKT